MIVFVAVVCGLVLRRLTPEERIQLFHKIIDLARHSATTARVMLMRMPPGCEEFYAALRTRTRWALITPVIVAAFVDGPRPHAVERRRRVGRPVAHRVGSERRADHDQRGVVAADVSHVHPSGMAASDRGHGWTADGRSVDRTSGRSSGVHRGPCRRGASRRVVESGGAPDISQHRSGGRRVQRLWPDGRHDDLGIRAAVSGDDSAGCLEARLAGGGSVRHLSRCHRGLGQRVDACRSAGGPARRAHPGRPGERRQAAAGTRVRRDGGHGRALHRLRRAAARDRRRPGRDRSSDRRRRHARRLCTTRKPTGSRKAT